MGNVIKYIEIQRRGWQYLRYSAFRRDQTGFVVSRILSSQGSPLYASLSCIILNVVTFCILLCITVFADIKNKFAAAVRKRPTADACDTGVPTVTLVRPGQPENISAPMLVTPFSMITVLISELSKNGESPKYPSSLQYRLW